MTNRPAPRLPALLAALVLAALLALPATAAAPDGYTLDTEFSLGESAKTESVSSSPVKLGDATTFVPENACTPYNWIYVGPVERIVPGSSWTVTHVAPGGEGLHRRAGTEETGVLHGGLYSGSKKFADATYDWRTIWTQNPQGSPVVDRVEIAIYIQNWGVPPETGRSGYGPLEFVPTDPTDRDLIGYGNSGWGEPDDAISPNLEWSPGVSGWKIGIGAKASKYQWISGDDVRYAGDALQSPTATSGRCNANIPVAAFSNQIRTWIKDDPVTGRYTIIDFDRQGWQTRNRVYDAAGNILWEDTGNTNIRSKVFGPGQPPAKVGVLDPSDPAVEYAAVLDVAAPDDPDDPSKDSGITVYIKNSQTGALIANANVALDALVDDEYHPVTNRTEPSGIFSINLQPTGGGKPNPDGYRLIVTADGYNNPMPEINFTLGDYRKYFECFLDPIAGGPVNVNKTFIDFFVRDMSSNPISGATVKFGKYTLITNSAGYTVFEVDKNNNYSWTVSKSGYGPLTGNAVIGDDPRHTIRTCLAPIVTPTTTTPIPTSPPIGPTPTMTAPTGEPVSNWLEWFAAHFGMILGGGVEIGKIFMWLCFTVPVGVYVGKESKAGAAGFMAGAGIVTLFFVLIGWVPIWLVVLLALVIGLLYAKVFNAQDNGGGR